MFEKRHRITLLFNANKAYNRQVVEGVGEYPQTSRLEWDISIEEGSQARIENIKKWLGDGVIADYDGPEIEKLLADAHTPVVDVDDSYHQPERYPPIHYIAMDNATLVESVFLHLKEKGVRRFVFYGLPTPSGKHWAVGRERASCRLVVKEKYHGVVYRGLETASESWQHTQNRLADWLRASPPQTGIIAATGARVRHVLQVYELLRIPVPEKLCVIGIDNEELTRYLSRVAPSSVAQSTRQMGCQAAKLLHRLLNNGVLPLQRQLVPPVCVVERRSTDYRSLNDPSVIQAMHYIHSSACKDIRVERVLDAVGISHSNLEKHSKEEVGETIHAVIHNERLERACGLLVSISLSIDKVSQTCGYPSLQYFCSVSKKEYDVTPREYRDRHSKVILQGKKVPGDKVGHPDHR